MKRIGMTTINGFINKGQVCSVVNCEKKSRCKAYCFKHYQRFIKTGDPLKTPTGREHGKRSICMVKGCNGNVEGQGYCIKHYKQVKRHCAILTRTRFDKNEIVNLGDTSEILLYNKTGKNIARALIDSDRVEIAKNYKWVAVKKGKAIYVKTDIKVQGQRQTLYLTNLIFGQKLDIK